MPEVSELKSYYNTNTTKNYVSSSNDSNWQNHQVTILPPSAPRILPSQPPKDLELELELNCFYLPPPAKQQFIAEITEGAWPTAETPAISGVIPHEDVPPLNDRR